MPSPRVSRHLTYCRVSAKLQFRPWFGVAPNTLASFPALAPSTTGAESLPTLPDSSGRVGCWFRFDMASMIDNVARAARSFLLLEIALVKPAASKHLGFALFHEAQ
jgi:hypothetical protein